MTYPNEPQGRQPESWEVQPTQYIPPAQAQGYQHGQPQHGYPQHGYPQQGGQPAPRPGQPPVNPFGAESNETFGIAGTVLALLGGILGIVALTGLTWISLGGAGGRINADFGDLHDVHDNFDGFATVYFSWFAWVALILTVLAAVGSSFPSPAVRALRIIGVVVGVAAAGLSFLALDLRTDGTYTDYLKHARAGFYLLVLAYLLAAIGAGIGPSKVSTGTAYRR